MRLGILFQGKKFDLINFLMKGHFALFSVARLENSNATIYSDHSGKHLKQPVFRPGFLNYFKNDHER